MLRAPPFPNARPAGTPLFVAPAARTSRKAIEALAEAIATHRVGGDYWLAPAGLALNSGPTLIRPGCWSQAHSLAQRWQSNGDDVILSLGRMPGHTRAMLDGTFGTVTVAPECDPWSLIETAGRIVAAPGDDVALLAAVAGKPVIDPATGQAIDRGFSLEILSRQVDTVTYHDPFSGRPISAGEWIEVLGAWRQIIDRNREIGTVRGIAAWKREAIASFLWAGRPATIARARAAPAAGKAVAIWPSRVSQRVRDRLKATNGPLVQIEDGFIRSQGLGTHLHPPQSIVCDRAGIYYDSGQTSDLERLLAETAFDAALCDRARRLIQALLAGGITKYAAAPPVDLPLPRAGRRVLVAGQVADDRSVLLGGCGVGGNLDLLRRVRALEPDAYIVFKPHPDVVSGLRKGHVAPVDAARFADIVLPHAPLASLLAQVDAVHVLTSLAGFEALLRGREVVTHGHPFYAGWGLTHDLAPPIARRGRRLTLEQLVAATLILYPRYRDPVTGLPCPPEIVVGRRGIGPQRHPGLLQRLRMAQGRIALSGRAMASALA